MANKINMKQRIQNASKTAPKAAIKQLAINTAIKYGVPPQLVLAIIQQESGFNPNAVSGVGAQGLMQLMPPTARELGVKNPFDPQENVNGGVRYIKKMLNMFGGDVALALAAYNAGAGKVIKAGKRIPNIKETQNYVKSILGQLNEFSNDVNDFIVSNPTLALTPLYWGAMGGKATSGLAKGIYNGIVNKKPVQNNNQANTNTQQGVQPINTSSATQTVDQQSLEAPQAQQIPQTYQIGDMTIAPNQEGVYQFDGTPTGIDTTKVIQEGIENIPTVGGVLDTVTEKVTPQITGQLDKYGNAILENAPTKADIQGTINQQRRDTLNLIKNAPNMSEYLKRIDAASQRVNDVINQDPRLQNQGYYINPKVYDNIALGNSFMTGQILSPEYYLDRQRLQYEANVANKMGVPYQDYIAAVDGRRQAAINALTPTIQGISNIGIIEGNNYGTQMAGLGNQQNNATNLYGQLNNSNQIIGAYGIGAGGNVAQPYNTALPSAIQSNVAKGKAGIDVGMGNVNVQADMTKSLMQPQGGVDMVKLLEVKNDAARVPYQNLESLGKYHYYNNMGGYMGSMITPNPNSLQQNPQLPSDF